MRSYFSRCLLGIVIALNLVISAQAQMAQVPIMTQSSAAEPNLVFVFDDSGSMDESQMYQFGTAWDAWGMKNPETGNSVQNFNRGSWASYSPDVNVMYYDPRILYQRQVNSHGVSLVAGSLANNTSFKVYFYNPVGSTTKHVGNVSVTKGGTKYSTTATMTFSAPPAGGVRATGTVTVNSSKVITGITVTYPGSGYDDCTTPSITITPGTTGTQVKYIVNMLPDPGAVVLEVNKKWTCASPVTSLTNFFHTGSPAGYLPDAGSPLATGADATVRYPNTADSTVPKYPKFAARTDCAGNYCSWTEELQNYANWNLYHSTRVKLARTGISLSLKAFPSYDPSGHELPASFRLGWGTINGIQSSSNLDAGVSLFTQARKDAFYTWLTGSSTNPSGDTPNRLAMDRVGQYYSRYDSDGPWGTNPNYLSVSTSANTTTPGETQASCRRSNMLLLTDGYWNGSGPSPSLGNIDNTAGPPITSVAADGTVLTYQYTPVAPKMDSISNTLADVAMKYWVNDLRPDLANNVKPPIGLTYPTWQNVSFYGIGLGIYGTLEQSESVLGQLTAGTLSWPNAVADSPTAIDDMWHAAVNSGGDFLNAGDADSLTSSIENMLASINKASASDTGLAASTGQIDAKTDTRIYKPVYRTGAWSGNIEAYDLVPGTLQLKLTLDPVTNLLTPIPKWQVVSTDPNNTKVVVSTIPSAANRVIVVGNGASSSPKVVDFKYLEMSAAGLTSLMAATGTGTGAITVNAQLIDYLRGDTSNDANHAGNYRVREAPLGDIVNSRPVFVRGNIDLLYDATGSSIPGASSYRTYVNVKKARPEGVLFVGANDGMLHAFRDGASSGDPVAGDEIFAYVPKAVLPNLSTLAHKKYGQTDFPHKYFVDGRLVETDAYFGSAWANLVVGSTGAGAKSVFALQVPDDPLTVSGNNLLWEVSSTTTGFGELGYLLADVQTGVLPTGEWVAIFGNGYFSASGSAQLFVVNLQTGALIQKIDTLSGPNNGLSGVTLVRDSTQRVKGAYAGDIKGNLWKFDLSSTSTASGFVGLSGVPLLAVGSTQAITTAPVLVNHPSGGYVVSVATGKLFELGDVNTTGLQRVYGVWDSEPFGSTTTPSGVTQTGITNLVQGSWAGKTYIDWTCKRGWYVNMSNDPKERNIYPLVGPLTDNSLIVASMSPSNLVTSACTELGSRPGWSARIKGTSSSCPVQPDPSATVPVLPVCHGADCECTSNSAGGTCTCTGSDCCIGSDCGSSSSPVVPPNDCGEKTLVPNEGCIAGIQKYLELTPRCSPKIIEASCPIPSPGGSVKRQWRQLFMR
jgi:type IV pilus assembly protein PilY1